eukprot:NODE_4457_length_673_cov_38.653722.p1 GENE.NODE_4457_length_673_cov_38.653722~~NODE_4457_length_673_cov_38.653722.p1  ORF type:complete len:207 (+),score=47.46 NODE_4457_length_673_cov_38.653722:41-622(+)
MFFVTERLVVLATQTAGEAGEGDLKGVSHLSGCSRGVLARLLALRLEVGVHPVEVVVVGLLVVLALLEDGLDDVVRRDLLRADRAIVLENDALEVESDGEDVPVEDDPYLLLHLADQLLGVAQDEGGRAESLYAEVERVLGGVERDTFRRARTHGWPRSGGGWAAGRLRSAEVAQAARAEISAAPPGRSMLEP